APHEKSSFQVVGRSTRPGWNTKHDHLAVRVIYLINIDAKSECLKELLRYPYGIVEGLSAYHRPWLFVSHTEHQQTTSFIGKCNTIFTDFLVVELSLRLLELQALVFARRAPPQVNLLRCRAHSCNTIQNLTIAPEPRQPALV